MNFRGGLLGQIYPSARYETIYGLFINKTIYRFENAMTYRKVCVDNPTILWLSIWNSFPESNTAIGADVLIAQKKRLI